MNGIIYNLVFVFAVMEKPIADRRQADSYVKQRQEGPTRSDGKQDAKILDQL